MVDETRYRHLSATGHLQNKNKFKTKQKKKKGRILYPFRVHLLGLLVHKVAML